MPNNGWLVVSFPSPPFCLAHLAKGKVIYRLSVVVPGKLSHLNLLL